jgi:hypothetical protein
MIIPWYGLFNAGLLTVFSSQKSCISATLLEVEVNPGSLLQPMIAPIATKAQDDEIDFYKIDSLKHNNRLKLVKHSQLRNAMVNSF